MVFEGVQHYKRVKSLASALLEFEAFCARVGKQSHILEQLDRGARELFQTGAEILGASSLEVQTQVIIAKAKQLSTDAENKCTKAWTDWAKDALRLEAVNPVSKKRDASEAVALSAITDAMREFSAYQTLRVARNGAAEERIELGAGNRTAVSLADLPDGEVTLRVRAEKSDGTLAAALSATLTRDTAPPADVSLTRLAAAQAAGRASCQRALSV
jgi:hypothetical protein